MLVRSHVPVRSLSAAQDAVIGIVLPVPAEEGKRVGASVGCHAEMIVGALLQQSSYAS